MKSFLERMLHQPHVTNFDEQYLLWKKRTKQPYNWAIEYKSSLKFFWYQKVNCFVLNFGKERDEIKSSACFFNIIFFVSFPFFTPRILNWIKQCAYICTDICTLAKIPPAVDEKYININSNCQAIKTKIVVLNTTPVVCSTLCICDVTFYR